MNENNERQDEKKPEVQKTPPKSDAPVKSAEERAEDATRVLLGLARKETLRAICGALISSRSGSALAASSASIRFPTERSRTIASISCRA